MSAASSKYTPGSPNRGSSRKRMNSQEDHVARTVKRPFDSAQLRLPVVHSSQDVGYAQYGEAGYAYDLNHGISALPSQAPPAISDLPFLNNQSADLDTQSGMAQYLVGGDPIRTETYSIETEPYPALGDRTEDTRTVSEEVLSMSIFPWPSNTYNEILPPQNLAVNTGGGAYLGAAHFSGGNHTFGTVNINNTFTTICSSDGEFTEVQRNLISDYIANHAALPAMNDNLNRNFLTQLIISLPRAEAVFNDYQTKKKSGLCLEGTRVALLREMADWVTGIGDSRMYVLSGLAGIGKSTVACTVASRAADLNLLGASFFFSRDEADRKNAKKFFTTIAYQLCVYNESFSKAIGDALLTERGSAATTKDPQEQLKALILDPLRDIVRSRARPVLLVIDALDECEEEDALSVLTGLRRLVQSLPPFKVILTTRPKLYIDHFFVNQRGHTVFYLQNIEDKVVDGDIQLYLEHSLSIEQVKKHFPRSQWRAKHEEIDSLVRVAGRLFIIASTTVRYIFDKVARNPAAQMQKLLLAFSQDRTPFKDLDHFYTVILRNLIPADCNNHDAVARYQSVVGAIIFIQSPLSVTTLAHLIMIDAEEIHAVLDMLQSVILLGNDDIPWIYHKSFPDYITDSRRCQDVDLCLDPRMGHTKIAMHCFEMMGQYLKYNLLGLGNPARYTSNEDGLAREGITDKQLEDYIPQELRYACVYWGNHLEVANHEDVNLTKGLEEFANQRMLPWFEVLSLIKKLDLAHRSLHVALKVVDPTSSNLSQLLSDGLRFISKFYEIIERSALHTYYSALMLTPTDSVLYHRYFNGDIHNICNIIGGLEKWDAVVASLNHGEEVKNVQFSPDSTMVASQSRNVLKVWDAATGTPISTIEGNRVAITNDFSAIASTEDNIITFYNVNSSEQGATFASQTEITSIAISSESSRIAAMLSDGTVCLWNSGNGELMGSFDDYHRNKDWDFLQFSATGTRLAYLSANEHVCLRNGIHGGFIAYLDCNSSDHIWHMAKFSLDGSRIACLSYENSGLELWSCDDGELIGFADDHGDDLAISENGSLLATVSDSWEVKLWSGNSGNPELLLIEVLLDQYAMGVAFSPDDLLAITTGTYAKLYDTKGRSFKFISTISISGFGQVFSPDSTRLVGWSEGILCLSDIQLGSIKASRPSPNNDMMIGGFSTLAFSMDCSRLACALPGPGGGDTIVLWETGNLTKRRIVTIRKPHMRYSIYALVFSPDGKQFASGSYDGIKLWDSKDGALRGDVQYYDGRLCAVGISNSMLAAAGDHGVVLWDYKTLDHIHSFSGIFMAPVSFSANGTFLAAAARANASIPHMGPDQLIVFDVTRRTCIATFEFRKQFIHQIVFLPDNSQIVAQPEYDDEFLTFNLVNGKVKQGPIFEHLIQLHSMPFWHGASFWVANTGREQLEGYVSQCHVMGLFSRHDDPVPVLWIPPEFYVKAWAQGRSMIVFGCEDSRLLFVQQPSCNHY